MLLLLGFFLYFPESIFVFGKTKHEIEGGYRVEERKNDPSSTMGLTPRDFDLSLIFANPPKGESRMAGPRNRR